MNTYVDNEMWILRYCEKPRIKWSPHELAKAFPRNISVAERAIRNLNEDIFFLQEEIAIHQFSWVSDTTMRMRLKFLWDLERIGIINRKLAQKEFLKKYLSSARASKEIGTGKVLESHIEQARQYPISQLIEINRSGFAPCLWHNEKTPSMKYYPKDNKVKCFGCGQYGDSIAVYMALHPGILFLDAVRGIMKI